MPNFYRRDDEAQIMDATAKATCSAAHLGVNPISMKRSSIFVDFI
jgi:hypothetical protein